MILPGEVYVDDRIGAVPNWRLGGDAGELMRVPEEITKCVAFLAAKADAETNYRYGGTAFLIAANSPSRPLERAYLFLVTARHNIKNAQADGSKLYLRLNMKDGTSRIIHVAGPWFYPEDEASDVAVTPIILTPPAEFDVVYFPEAGFADPEVMTEHRIGIGDELMVSGLFAYHYGAERNLPIVRSGIIAAMPEEPLVDVNSGLPYDAYLAEVRSIGGLSGSPVFVVIAPGRVLGESVRVHTRHFFLLGLVRGHWDKPDEMADGFADSERDSINTGIAIVTPVAELEKILSGEEVQSEMKKADKESARKDAPKEDSAFGGETEFERFEKLASKLANTPKPKADEKDGG